MRIYDPRLGRFLSVDPLTKKYASWTPYLFAGNNPIRYVDINGMGPGDKFKSPDEAAHDFAKSYNDNSIAAKKEYASSIIKVTTAKEVYYTYVQPLVGTKDGSSSSTRGLLGPLEGSQVVADIHTHGNYIESYGFGNENFSSADVSVNDKAKFAGYLVTPSGTLQKYDPATSEITDLNKTDIPSDQTDPNKVNNIDALNTNLPKNEPTYGIWESIKHNILGPLIYGAQAVKGKEASDQKQQTVQVDSPTDDSCTDECQ
jgi:uncharacterized protein DUF4329